MARAAPPRRPWPLGYGLGLRNSRARTRDFSDSARRIPGPARVRLRPAVAAAALVDSEAAGRLDSEPRRRPRPLRVDLISCQCCGCRLVRRRAGGPGSLARGSLRYWWSP